MERKTLKFSYEGVYQLSHEPNFREKEIWICFHGYGQLTQFFMRKFMPFDREDRLFITPEGTNYQYLQNFQGRVGANWMTKHERELAITNNHQFLEQLTSQILEKYEQIPEINVLGFSQGAATATRWAAVWPKTIRRLLLWSGGFAQDLNFDLGKSNFKNTELYLVYGDQDEFLTEESFNKQKEILKELGKKAIIKDFSGGHELPHKVLAEFMN